MKENYSNRQDREIVKIAKRYRISPGVVLEQLDRLYDETFSDNIKKVEQTILEQILDYAINDKTSR